jgi:hypothetical protein
VFYAVAALVLSRRRELRGFLLWPGVLVPHVAAAALYFVWHQQLTGGAQQDTDLRIVLEKLRAFDPGAYLHQLWWFPLETALRFVPASVLVAYFWLRKEPSDPEARPHDASVAICASIACINYLPYWLWPSTASRYVMPLYPLAAYLIAHVLWRQSAARMRWVVNCLIATIAFKYVAALWVYPAYQREYRGDSERGGRDRRLGGGCSRDRRVGGGLECCVRPRCTSISATAVAIAAAGVAIGFRAVAHRKSGARQCLSQVPAWSQRRIPAMPRRCLR